MDSMEASRQIMWMIPFWMKVVMYLSLAVATYFFFQGLVAKYRFITAGKDPKQVLPPKLNFENFLVTIFFQGKVPRDGFVNVYHSMIFSLDPFLDLYFNHRETYLEIHNHTYYRQDIG
jgi:hypothetical protein